MDQTKAKAKHDRSSRTLWRFHLISTIKKLLYISIVVLMCDSSKKKLEKTCLGETSVHNERRNLLEFSCFRKLLGKQWVGNYFNHITSTHNAFVDENEPPHFLFFRAIKNLHLFDLLDDYRKVRVELILESELNWMYRCFFIPRIVN